MKNLIIFDLFISSSCFQPKTLKAFSGVDAASLHGELMNLLRPENCFVMENFCRECGEIRDMEKGLRCKKCTKKRALERYHQKKYEPPLAIQKNFCAKCGAPRLEGSKQRRCRKCINNAVAKRNLVTKLNMGYYFNPEDLEGEFWRPISGNPAYSVSSLGRIKSDLNRKGFNKILKHCVTKTCYPSVSLTSWNDGKKVIKRVSVHRLIALAFIPNPENKPCVNHINGNKKDYRIENLEWCTYAENAMHASRMGLLVAPRGEKQKTSKLTNEQVVEIRKLAKTLMHKELCKIFLVSKTTIGRIVRREAWTHI